MHFLLLEPISNHTEYQIDQRVYSVIMASPPQKPSSRVKALTAGARKFHHAKLRLTLAAEIPAP